MNLKIVLLFFSFFISALLFGQDNKVQLPYSEIPKYPRKSTTGIVMAKLIDELGYKYYWVTDSLLNDELKYTFNSSNLPRVLLKSVHQISESIVNCTSEAEIKQGKKIEEFSFADYRINTLLNLKGASNNIIENGEASLFLNWDLFIKSIASSDAYCDQIIQFRENNGNPSKLENDFGEEKPSKSKMFEQSIGADGLTNRQWVKIMRRGGGLGAFEKIGNTRNNNRKVIAKSRKEKRADVIVGDLETIDKSSKIVEGFTYTYFNNPPEQISFLFSNDNEYIEGIINWIIYINSGNSVKLSEMFRFGLDIVIGLDVSEEQTFVEDSYRDTVDKEENKVRLEFSEKCFEITGFSDILILEVQVIDNNQILFFGKSNLTSDFAQTPQQAMITLKKIEGDLLDRIIVNINLMRNGLYKYDKTIMNLGNY